MKLLKKLTLALGLGLILSTSIVMPVSAATDEMHGGDRTKREGLFTGRGLVGDHTKTSEELCEQYDGELETLKEKSQQAKEKTFKESKEEVESSVPSIMMPIQNWILGGFESFIENTVQLASNTDCENGLHIGVWIHNLATGIDLTGNNTFMAFAKFVSYFGFILAAMSFFQKTLVLFFKGDLTDAEASVPHFLMFVLTLFAIYQFPYLVQDVVNITSYAIDALMSMKVGFHIPSGGE